MVGPQGPGVGSAGAERTTVVRVHGLDVPVSIRDGEDAGPPLLLFNGVGGSLTHWADFRDAVHRTTVVFDVRSQFLGRRPSLRHFATLSMQVLDELNLERVDVLGLSWGGMAAQQLVHDHPRHVRRLVLASTTPGFASIPARPSSTLALIRPNRDPENMGNVVKKVYGGDFVRDPDLVYRLGLVRPLDRVAYRRQMMATLGWTSTHWLHTVRKPTLILHGSDDPVVPFVNAHLMKGLIRDARLHAVPGGGHLYLYTRPAELGRVVERFLAAA